MSSIQSLLAHASVVRVKEMFEKFDVSEKTGNLDIEKVKQISGISREFIDILEMTDIDGNGEISIDGILFYLETVVSECTESTANLVIDDLEKLFSRALQMKVAADEEIMKTGGKHSLSMVTKSEGQQRIVASSKIAKKDTPRSNEMANVVDTLKSENAELKAKLQRAEEELKTQEERINMLTGLLRRTKIRKRIASLKRDVKHRKVTLDEWLQHAKAYARTMNFVAKSYYGPMLAVAQERERKILMAEVVDQGRKRVKSRKSSFWFGVRSRKRKAKGEEDVETSDALTSITVRQMFSNIAAVAVSAQSFAADMERALLATGWTPKGKSGAKCSPKVISLPLQTPSTLCRLVRSVESASETNQTAIENVIQTLLMNQEREESALKRYISNYMMHAQRAIQQGKKSKIFRDTAAFARKMRPQVGSDVDQPLESLLVMPVQSLPKRRMLLRELLRGLDASHPSHRLVTDCLSHVEGMISRIDDHLNAKKLEKLASEHPSVSDKMSFPVQVRGRKYIMDGAMDRRTNFLHFKRRWCYLFSDCLMQCDDENRGMPFTDRILLASASVHDAGRLEFKIKRKVKDDLKVWHLRAESVLEKDHWMNTIQAEIDKCVRDKVLEGIRSYKTGI